MRSYDTSGSEPCLQDMLDDPIIVSFMDRDGISKQQIIELMTAARARLQTAFSDEDVEDCTLSDQVLSLDQPLDRPFSAPHSGLCCA